MLLMEYQNSSNMADFFRKIYLTELSGSFPYWKNLSFLTVSNTKNYDVLNKISKSNVIKIFTWIKAKQTFEKPLTK